MKFDYADFISAAVIGAVAGGFYLVGRYHEEYVNSKRSKADEPEPTKETATEQPE